MRRVAPGRLPAAEEVFPEGRPVDAIDQIDAIDEVGCGGVMRNAQCAMRNAKCGMGEGAAKRRAGAGGAAAPRPPKLAKLHRADRIGEQEVWDADMADAGEVVGLDGVEREEEFREVVAGVAEGREFAV